jgi:hypothetical protein
LPSVPVTVEWLATPGTEALLAHALSHASASLSAQRRFAGRMALDASGYRREFERMQQKFAALERYISAAGLAAAREVFATAQGSGAAPLPGDGATIRQALGVDSLGVAGVSLFIAAAPGRGGPPLRVGLSAVETGETIAAWTLAAGVPAGWCLLALDRAIDVAALSLTLAIDAPAGAGGWALGLGPPNPFTQFCANTDSSGSLSAPLALRVHATLPGVRMPLEAGAILADRAERPRAWIVPETAYETLAEVLTGAEPAVHHDKAFGFVQVHARGGGQIAAARLVVATPPDAWRVSADIYLAHAEANPAEFGILLGPDNGEAALAGELAALNDGDAGFSGWVTLPALGQRTISAVLPERGRDALAVYLITRQEQEPAFAWARFKSLRVHCLPA